MPQENIVQPSTLLSAMLFVMLSIRMIGVFLTIQDLRGLNIDNGSYKQYAVTFVENHDVQDRGTTSGYSPDPIRKDTLAANAYLLAMPGTPCVFYTHYLAYPKEIKAMIDARKLAGVTNTSSYLVYRTSRIIMPMLLQVRMENYWLCG